MSTMDSVRSQLLERYRDQIGRPRDEVTTPALLLDLDVAERNIAAMATRFEGMPAKLRPHIKVHKSIELARMTIDAGAVGVACATAWEAVVMARGGIEDVLVANQVIVPDKVAAVAELAREHRITLTVDDVRNVEQLSRAATAAGASFELLIELDVGMGRCGVRRIEDLLPIAERIELAIAGADLLAEHGHPCAEISAGGTGTYFITGANPRITEVQAGSYALLDGFHGNLVPGGFEVAMTVIGTVISRQGNTVVLDCGRKAVGIDFVTPPLVAFPDGEVRYYAEEHCLVDFPGPPPLDLGDRAEVMAGYGPTTVNLHDVFHVVEGGTVTDIWPVNPRGSGPPPFS
jgi:D-serine deaminase-like pyridoxal phosphate-dependent protein